MTAGPRIPPARADGQAATSTPHRDQLKRVPSTDEVIAFVALALAGSWIGYFLFTPMPSLTFKVFPATVTLHIVVGVVLVLYAVYLAMARRLPGGTPLDIPVLLFLGAYALATYASIDWRASIEPVLLLGAAIAAFYALSDLPLLNARNLRYAFMLVIGALSVYALWDVGNQYADYLRLTDQVEGLSFSNVLPPTVPRVDDVSDHPNVVAMVLVLALPFYALSAVRPASFWERVAGWAGLFIAGWAMFLTLSRGGWIGGGVGVAFTLLAAWVTVNVYRRETDGEHVTWEMFVPPGLSLTALAAIAGALALTVFGALAFLANSSTRPGWLFRSSLSAREDAWQAGLDIFRDNLLLGTGPNTFGLLYPQYGEHVTRFVVHTQHAHNGFLQVANDAGLAGLAALATIGAAVAYMLWRTWQEGSLQARLLAVGCSGALIGFCVHQQLDAGNIWKAPPFALAMLGAVIARNYQESVPPRNSTVASFPVRNTSRYVSLASRAMLPLLLVPLFLGWWRFDRPHYDFWRGLDDWNNGDATGLANMQQAVNDDSSMMPYQLALGVAQATHYNNTGSSDDALLNSARIHLERAAEIDPRSDLARANLARVYEMLGRDDDAAREARITRLADYHVPPVLVAGEVFEDLGRDEDAISTYGQVISMDAGLANSTFWQMTDWRREHFDEILRASTIGINPCTYGAFLVEAERTAASEIERSDLEQARDDCEFFAFTSGLGNDLALRVALAKVQATLGERDQALGHLQFAVNRQPDFGPARTELGRWFADGGDVDEARRQWVRGGELGEGESLRLLGDSYPRGKVPQQVQDRLEALASTSGSSVRNDLISVLYYRMRFWRLSPVFALIPGTWQDAVPRPYAEWQEALQRWN